MKKKIENSEAVRIEAEALARRHGVKAQRVIDIFLRLADIGWLAPNFPYRTALDEAIFKVGPAKALDVFEQEDLVVLARRVTLCDYLNYFYTPFHDLKQLEILTRNFSDHLVENRDSLIDTGRPRTSFERLPWMDWRLSTLYYTKPAADVRMIRNEQGDYVYEYAWEDPIPYDSSFPRSDGRLCGQANLSYHLTQDELNRVKDIRPRFFELKVEIINELSRAIHYRVADKLWENCLRVLTDGLPAEDAEFCLKVDSLFHGRTWKDYEDDAIMYNQLLLPGGGLSDLLEVIGHVEAELTIGAFRSTYETIEHLVEQDSLGRPHIEKGLCYSRPGDPRKEKLDSAVNQFIALEKKTDDFSRRFAYRVNQALEDEFREEVHLPELSLKSKLKRRFEPEVNKLLYWLHSHMETTGELPKIVFSESIIEQGLKTVEDFDTLEITIPQMQGAQDRIPFRLSKGNQKSKEFTLSRMEASFLWFLAEERRKGGTYWLLDPAGHKPVLRRIVKALELPPYFEKELEERPKYPRTWVWDFQNRNRKNLVSKINRKVKESAGIRGRVIPSPQDVDPARKGIYFLVKSIQHISIQTS